MSSELLSLARALRGELVRFDAARVTHWRARVVAADMACTAKLCVEAGRSAGARAGEEVEGGD
ncbi:MAG: hypothetical protein LC792_12495, partial [Actinobacteria bacterium]|nr:hypothetical protein [Actinomycetota bacterium]